MPDLHTQCPHCEFAYIVTPEQAASLAGRSFACTQCGQPFALAPSGAAFAQPVSPVPHVAYASGTDAKPNPLALASLICGCILCIPFAPGLAAVITGALGMRRAKDPAATGKGFAIAGLVLGILNLLGWGAYFGLIFAIMVPSLGRSRETANRVKCASNLRQLGQAMILYANENRGAYPDTLEHLLHSQDITAHVYLCPSSNDTVATGANSQAVVADMASGGHVSYVYAGKGLTNSSPAEAILAYEPMTNHGGDGTNLLFGDGHVDFLNKREAERLIKQVEAGQNPPSEDKPTTTGVEK